MADNSPSLAAEGALSGTVVEFVPSTNIPSIPGGIRVVGLIGTGLTYKTVSTTLTRGSTVNGLDTLSPSALSLPSTITDQNNVSYTLNEDYILSLPTSVSGATTNAPSSSQTLSLNINNDGVQTITLGTDASGAAVAADIQAKVRALTANTSTNQSAYLNFTATFSGTGYSGTYTLTSGTTPIGSVQVTGGTAATELKLGVANTGTETVGGNVSWSPSGAATFTGGVDVGATAMPTGNNLNGLTLPLYANGQSNAQTVVFTGTNVEPTEYTAITGTVSVTNGSAAVTGTGTSFTTALSVGQLIQFGAQAGVSYVIASIASNTSLTLGSLYGVSPDYSGTTNASTTLSGGVGIVEQMNAVLNVVGNLKASVLVEGSQNYIQVATVSTNNASLQLGSGTANAAIGFTPGVLIYGPYEPSAGVQYSFSYGTPKVTTSTLDDYGPQLFTDLTSITSIYGPVPTANTNGTLTTNSDGSTSTISLGSQIVFTNSANTGGIVVVQVSPHDGAPLAGFQNALNKLATVSGVNIVVCLTPDPMLYPSIVSNVVNCSAPLEMNERTAIMGLDPTSATMTSAIAQAASIDASGEGRRFLLLWPPQCQMTLGGNTANLDGSYLAAAVAGVRINGNNDVATPLLRQQLTPFTNVGTGPITRTNKLTLRNGGVTVIELQNNIVLVTEDTTTDRSTIDNQEYTVTEIVDFTASTTRTLLNSIFIGVKILSNTTSMITATIQVLLNNLVSLNIITDYRNVQATINSLDPRQIDISFEIAPVYGLRYISVVFSLET